MEVKDALKALGAERVVWVDDHFDDKPSGLAKMFVSNLDAIRKCANAPLGEILDRYEFSSDLAELEQYVADLKEPDRLSLQEAFFAQENVEKNMATQELSGDLVTRTCDLLGVKPEDRWTFADADAKLKSVCEHGDEGVGYVIDLNNASGGKHDGMSLLTALKTYGSKGTAFLLTHAANVDGEPEYEEQLRIILGHHEKPAEVPMCVISKERLSGAKDDAALQEALRVAIKRAGLHRSVHEVLQQVKTHLSGAFDTAALMLLAIPSEQLDTFVVERGSREGVSELHVVERAITAKLGERVRDLFASNEQVRQSTSRIRSLRSVALVSPHSYKLHRNLEQFRMLEVWEGPALINESFTPLAPGDVFEIDPAAFPEGQKLKAYRYLLLGQPCDIAMREKGNRNDETGILVPLNVIKQDSAKQGKNTDIKEPHLQFKIEGVQWACDFRAATSVRLEILDLASFRSDGCVTFDAGQQAPEFMLAGLKAAFAQTTKSMVLALEAIGKDRELGERQVASNADFSLSFRKSKAFAQIHHAKFAAAEKKARKDAQKPLPDRLTWSIRRVGRIKTPYAGSLLKNYLAVVGRDAFDVDFTQVDDPKAAQVEEVEAVVGAAPQQAH